jgi:hypothetical protein
LIFFVDAIVAYYFVACTALLTRIVNSVLPFSMTELATFALQSKVDLFGPDSEKLVDVLILMAECYRAVANYDEAETFLNQVSAEAGQHVLKRICGQSEEFCTVLFICAKLRIQKCTSSAMFGTLFTTTGCYFTLDFYNSFVPYFPVRTGIVSDRHRSQERPTSSRQGLAAAPAALSPGLACPQ